MDGVEGQEHVQDAGQLVGLLELVVGAAGEPGQVELLQQLCMLQHV